jgi:hypothetical protein
MHWLTERTNSDISATGLYIEFVRLSRISLGEPSEAEKFIEQFVADAGTYRNFDFLESDSREKLFFDRREVLDVGVIYPVALRLWRCLAEGSISQDRLVVGLRALESWLVRRMSLRLTTQNYNRVMVDILTKMATHSDPVAGLIDQLTTYPVETPTAWWPDDQAFREQLEMQPMYGNNTQARVRMILEAAEARLHTSKTERLPLPSRLTIEHVIPQTWETTWPLIEGSNDGGLQRRVEHIHRLGNLTLVTSSLNPALSNDPWGAKRGELAQHSALRLNARLVHDHPDYFDESSIDRRGAALADLLLAEWPGPGSDVWLPSE